MIHKVNLSVSPVTVWHIARRTTAAKGGHCSGFKLLVIAVNDGEFSLHNYGPIPHNSDAGYFLWSG